MAIHKATRNVKKITPGVLAGLHTTAAWINKIKIKIKRYRCLKFFGDIIVCIGSTFETLLLLLESFFASISFSGLTDLGKCRISATVVADLPCRVPRGLSEALARSESSICLFDV